MSIADALNFNNRKVVVTGASDGIGYGVARMFLEAGAAVTVTGTRHASAYDNDFTGLDFHALDVQSESAIREFTSRFDHLDVLVNCIGSVLYQKREFERENFARILDINLTGIMQLCTGFYPLLKSSSGNIVNLDSVAAVRPALNNPAYSASKAGLVQLGKTLAMKWGPRGVRVNNVAPGMVPTRMTANQSTAEHEERFRRTNPIPRFGTPDDIAGAVIFLASPLASYITGHQLVVDGGMTL